MSKPLRELGRAMSSDDVAAMRLEAGAHHASDVGRAAGRAEKAAAADQASRDQASAAAAASPAKQKAKPPETDATPKRLAPRVYQSSTPQTGMGRSNSSISRERIAKGKHKAEKDAERMSREVAGMQAELAIETRERHEAQKAKKLLEEQERREQQEAEAKAEQELDQLMQAVSKNKEEEMRESSRTVWVGGIRGGALLRHAFSCPLFCPFLADFPVQSGRRGCEREGHHGGDGGNGQSTS